MKGLFEPGVLSIESCCHQILIHSGPNLIYSRKPQLQNVLRSHLFLVTTNHRKTLLCRYNFISMVVTRQIHQKTWLLRNKFIGKHGCHNNKFIGKHGCHDTNSSENMVVTIQIHRKTLLLRNKFIGKSCGTCFDFATSISEEVQWDSSENRTWFSALIPRTWHCSTKGRFLRNPNGRPQKTHLLAMSVLRKQHRENIAYVRGTQVFSEEVHWDSSDLALIFASSSSEGSQTSDSSDT